jgi:hypothetical protein
MTVTPTSLTRAAGISAAVAGLLFIAVQIKHPHSFERPLAVPTGVALIGLGISLWRDQRKPAAITADGLAPAGALS